jgi:hypothetical protein
LKCPQNVYLNLFYFEFAQKPDLKRNFKKHNFKNICDLYFKFILILNPQNSIFGKYRDLFEFENLFDLNSNLGFKFKFAE